MSIGTVLILKQIHHGVTLSFLVFYRWAWMLWQNYHLYNDTLPWSCSKKVFAVTLWNTFWNSLAFTKFISINYEHDFSHKLHITKFKPIVSNIILIRLSLLMTLFFIYRKNVNKIQNNDFWGLCPGLNGFKMDPKISKKKYVAHSKKIKSAICPGYYLRGLPVYFL